MIFLELFLTFFKIGAFTIGGGYAMLPLIQQEVLNHGWIELESLINFIAVAESTPGPVAINMATYVGAVVAGDAYGGAWGILGAAVATLGTVLPSFIIILVVAKFYQKFQQSFAVKGCMTGLKPCVVGLIGAAVLSIGASVMMPGGFSAALFTNAELYITLAIFALCAVLAFKKTHPILIICLSAVIGIAAGYLLP
ncbi:MAG: chromate transporter [Clostridia bacterium]|nr:chromate transporter [Clostridia bacterium]